jgi:hypothetical protein
MLPLKSPTPTKRHRIAATNATSKAIRKWPATMHNAPIVTVAVRPSQRSAT